MTDEKPAKYVRCERCDGKRSITVPDVGWTTCPRCFGAGWLVNTESIPIASTPAQTVELKLPREDFIRLTRALKYAVISLRADGRSITARTVSDLYFRLCSIVDETKED